MQLCGIDFGNILGASGVQGFFGEGWWFHNIYKMLWRKQFDFSGMTFVSKTVTLRQRKGNVKGFLPSWARIDFFSGHMLNSMGLPNRGIETIVTENEWQKRTKPFMISIASVEPITEKRLDELSEIILCLKMFQKGFRAPFGLQINLSCPNTGHNLSEVINESEEALIRASFLNVPLMPKYSIASAPIQAIMELNKNPFCHGICVSNTLPFGFEGIDWQKVWGTKVSPLARLGGGGLSGKTLCPLVCEWIVRLRDAGFTKPINGGGGILCAQDVKRYHKAGASSVFLGSGAKLRPWRVQEIIRCANSLTWR